MGARFLLGRQKCHKVDFDDEWTTVTLLEATELFTLNA